MKKFTILIPIKKTKTNSKKNINGRRASMDITLNEFISLTSPCWNEKYQPLIFDMKKDIYTGRYLLGFNSTFVPNTNPL